MSLIKQYIHELREMIEACEQQDEYINNALHETNQEDWSGVETTYTINNHAYTQKN